MREAGGDRAAADRVPDLGASCVGHAVGGWNYNWTWWAEAADAGGEERLFDFADDGLPVICTAANASGPNALDPAVFNECVAKPGARRRG